MPANSRWDLIRRLKVNVHKSVHRKNIPIYIKQDAALHGLFNLETDLHVSGVTSTHYQERKQLYLQHLLFFTPLLHVFGRLLFD